MLTHLPPEQKLPKSPTGIDGLDEITAGGLPKGRPTLVCGGPGCGKTLLAMEFLIRGAIEYNEPGVFVAFEETPEELAQNVASIGFDLPALVAEGKILIDYIHLDPTEFEESGSYDLSGLFIRLEQAIHRIRARRVALDTVEVLFSGLQNAAILRAELRRLFRWLKEKEVTAVITAERNETGLTRYGLEEYVSDCVILLEHLRTNQIATRRLQVIKYRGSRHGTNAYPFIIGDTGVNVIPITSVGLDYSASAERISSGIPALDDMLGGGLYRGSTVLLSGAAGTGKTTISAGFLEAACRRGEKGLFFSFEESPAQIVRNMQSVGLKLEPWLEKETLRILANRPPIDGLEAHLNFIIRQTLAFQPDCVVLDPISGFLFNTQETEVKGLIIRLIDFMKARGITLLMTSLTRVLQQVDHTEAAISSLADSWIVVRNLETIGERTRGIYIVKSRGMAHSNEVREFRLTSEGVVLQEMYLGPEGVLSGAARRARMAQDQAEEQARQLEIARLQETLESKGKILKHRLAVMQAEFEAEKAEILGQIARLEQKQNKPHKLTIPVDEDRPG